MNRSKQYGAWLETRLWCITHPNERAAIVTPEGTFTIVFTPKPATLLGAAVPLNESKLKT